ncbi:MAG: hypothetical protein ABI791_09725 [Acidobacteriota bacterium]
MRTKLIYLLFLVLLSAASANSQGVAEVVAANGQKHAVAGKDRTRGDNEIVVYTLDRYRKDPPFKNGVDVYVVGGKVEAIQDRAGAVYIQNKPDPGPVASGKDGVVLSANGEARKWVVANIKVGEAVAINETITAKNAAGEVIPAASIPCFAGAYYRKAVTSFDTWTGIAGIVKLGTPKFDEQRLDPAKKQPLDNFSVYMGGNAGGNYEVDAGLTWAFTTDASGKLSERRNAWRPFWRTKTWNNAPNHAEYTWYPGETVQIAVYLVAPKKLRLIVADANPRPKKMFQVDFDADGFAPNVARQFKRVNAIDQFGNEGKPVQPTKAEVTGAEWLQTILLRGAGSEAKQIPMDRARFTDMRCSDRSHIVVTETNPAKGAEKVDIYGAQKK